MKKIYALLLAISFVGFSCNDKVEGYNHGGSTESEVELKIKTPQSGTRATIPYPSAEGTDDEKQINSLNLIAFNAETEEFAYMRPANTTSQYIYRITVPNEPLKVNVAVLANCPATVITDLLASDEWKNSDKKWESFQKLLIDSDPARLVNSAKFQALPMSSELVANKEIDLNGVANWGTVQLLRSVASADVLIEKNNETNKLILTKIHAYYAADRGYFAAIEIPNTSPRQYETPTGMKTELNTLTATNVSETQTGERTNVKTYNAIAGQLYMYDNTATTNGNGNKCTRVIIEGQYDGATESSFYPVFLLDGDKYRPVIRNRKYLIKINKVYGPGYGSKEEAAESSPIDMEVDIIDWNVDDTDIGIGGPSQYYVSVERKKIYLSRGAGSTDEIKITYTGDNAFTMNFKTPAANGSQTTINNGIANDRFEVTLVSNNGKATLMVKAKGDFSTTDSQNHDVVILKYKDLQFEIEIHQLDEDKNDWESGGHFPGDLY